MIRALLFDFGQTLVDSAGGFMHAEKVAKERIFAELFPSPDTGSWEAFLSEYRRLRSEFHRRSDLSRTAIWEAVYRHFDLDPDPEQLKKWETDYWVTVKSQTRPFLETMEVLEKLSTRYRLGLVTNTQGQKQRGEHRITLFPKLEKFFAAIVVAGEMDIPPKPDPKPFKLCLQRLGIMPADAAFIGDDWRIDIRGSQYAGLHPVWLKHHSVNRNWPDVQTDVPIITGLDQLPELINKFQVSMIETSLDLV